MASWARSFPILRPSQGIVVSHASCLFLTSYPFATLTAVRTSDLNQWTKLWPGRVPQTQAHVERTWTEAAVSSLPGDLKHFAFEGKTMVNRRGLTIVELFVVLAIISVLLVLLFPAVQAVRERARETVCKNNLHQINLAIAQFAEVHKGLPRPGSPGLIGGWSVEILPFIGQQNLQATIVSGTPIADAPESLFRSPPIFRCPRRTVLDHTPESVMSVGHYVFVPATGRESFLVFDAPVALSVPWMSGPETDYTTVIGSIGPHSNGFFYANGFQQGVGFMLDGQDIR